MELLVVGLAAWANAVRASSGAWSRRRRCGRGFRPPARREEARALGIEPYESIAAAVAARHFDAAFVCTAPLTHAGIIGELLDAGLPVFTELNLVDDGYDALIAKPRRRACRCF